MQPENQQQATNQTQPFSQQPEQQVPANGQVPPQVPTQNSTDGGTQQGQEAVTPPGGGAKKAVGDKLRGLMPKLVKVLLVIFVVIGALFFINLFAPRAIQILKNNNPLMTPTPEPTPTSTPVVNFPPSKYASDPEVIQIENQLDRLEKGLNAIEFTDDTLHPPLLDWEISFTQ